MPFNSFQWDRISHPSSAPFKHSDGSFKARIAPQPGWLDGNFQLDLGLQPRPKERKSALFSVFACCKHGETLSGNCNALV